MARRGARPSVGLVLTGSFETDPYSRIGRSQHAVSRDCATIIYGRQPLAVDQEALMASKDKGGRATKKVGKNLKEKRQDKKSKRAESDAKRNRAT